MTTDSLLQIGVNELMPDPTQPRKTFLADEMSRLAASVAARGILLPLRVIRDEDRKCWRIVTGECRWRAAKLAGLATVPCLPVTGEISEADILADQVVENTVRNSLLPMELARALAKLKSLKKCTSQHLAEHLGISGAAISKSEALLSLPPDIQTLVDDGKVPPAAAYEISRLPDEASQCELAQSVAAGKMNRDAVADAVRSRIGKRNVTPKAGRISCKLDGGVSITVSSGEPLNWDELLSALDVLRKQAKKLYEDGKDVTALARLLRAS
jgi:ParB family chromosome partitioning protein